MEFLDITISSRHADLSEALVATTRQKLTRLERLGTRMVRAEVHFYEEQNPRITEREVCEVWMDGHGDAVRCKVTGRGSVAIDRAVTKLEHQSRRPRTAFARPAAVPDETGGITRFVRPGRSRTRVRAR